MLKVHLMNLAISFALLSGCSPMKGQLTDEELAAQWQDLTIENGSQLNGVKLNGVKLNGVKLNGVKLNGVKLNGVKLNGVKLLTDPLKFSRRDIGYSRARSFEVLAC